MKKKFELTNITMDYKGRKLHRIKALKDFNDVKKDDLGGWIENENNLSHYNDCWVYDEGKIYDYGQVYGDGMVYEYGEVYGYGQVYGHGKVFGCGEIYEYGEVHGYGKLYDDGVVHGDGEVYENGQVYEDGEVIGHGRVFGNGKVFKGIIATKISIPYKAIIQMQCKYRTINALLTEDDKIVFNVGCRNNITKEEFIDRIYNDEGGLEKNPHRQEYLKAIDYMENYLLSKKGDVK